MTLAHKRLAMICRRLLAIGATPVVRDDEIDELDDAEADAVARAEADRLALLVQASAELARRTPRKPPPAEPPPPPDPMVARLRIAEEMDKRYKRNGQDCG